MYPKEIIWGLTLYDIMLALAVVTALLIFSRFSSKRRLSARLHNFVLADAVVTVIAGYFFAVLFQAVYNLIASGKFELNENTGATFLGGFVGGAGVLFAFWFGVGAAVFKNRDREHIKALPDLIEVFSVCVPAAHAVGRIGCFFAGCCHGIRVHGFPGVYMEQAGGRVLPVQLFESAFLILLTVFLWIRADRRKSGNLSFYLVLYGIWRFFIEYLRGDYRGETVVSFLTPSQLISVIMIVFGLCLWFFVYRKKREPASASEEKADRDE